MTTNRSGDSRGSVNEAAGQLTRKSIGGALWFGLNAVAVKAVSLFTQIVLAYLLAPEDFGLISLALVVSAATGTLFRAGLAQVLVERSPDTDALARNSFWLSMTMGVVVALAAAAVAPVVSDIVGEPDVAQLIWIMTLVVPIQAASVVPRALLLSDLEFGKVAGINGAQIVSRSLITIGLAALGFGAYSFAWAEVISSSIELYLYRREHDLWIRKPRDRSSWSHLTRDTGLLVASGLVNTVISFGDYVLLGVLSDATEVGLYYFGYRLSIQGLNLLTTNLGRVVFPALAQLPQGSEDQLVAFRRSVRALAGIGVPLGVVGAALGYDFVALMFSDEWRRAGEVFAILSVAAVIRTVADSRAHLLLAQGRFREHMFFGLAEAPLFLAAVALGAWHGDAVGAAVAVAAHASVAGWALYSLAVRPCGGSPGELPRVLAAPVAASLIPVGAGLLVAEVVGLGVGAPARLVIPLLMLAVGYWPLLSRMSLDTSRELRVIFQEVRARLLPSRR